MRKTKTKTSKRMRNKSDPSPEPTSMRAVGGGLCGGPSLPPTREWWGRSDPADAARSSIRGFDSGSDTTREQNTGRPCERVQRQSTEMDNPFGDGLDIFNFVFGRTGCIVEYAEGRR